MNEPPRKPRNAANQGFVPLPNVARHVERPVGAGRAAVRAHGGQIAHGNVVVGRIGRGRGAARRSGSKLLLVPYSQ